VRGAKEGGIEGFLKGMRNGVMGAIFKPSAGAIDLLVKTAQGWEAGVIEECPYKYHRLRLPRPFYNASHSIKNFNSLDAQAYNELMRLKMQETANSDYLIDVYEVGSESEYTK